MTRHNNRWYVTDVECIYATEFSTKCMTTLSAGRAIMEGRDRRRVLGRWIHDRCDGRGARVSTLHLQNGLRNLRNKSGSTVLKCPSMVTDNRDKCVSHRLKSHDFTYNSLTDWVIKPQVQRSGFFLSGKDWQRLNVGFLLNEWIKLPMDILKNWW